jgi:hypothetical protein
MTAPLYKRLGIEWKHGAVGGEACERWVCMGQYRYCTTERDRMP